MSSLKGHLSIWQGGTGSEPNTESRVRWFSQCSAPPKPHDTAGWSEPHCITLSLLKFIKKNNPPILGVVFHHLHTYPLIDSVRCKTVSLKPSATAPVYHHATTRVLTSTGKNSCTTRTIHARLSSACHIFCLLTLFCPSCTELSTVCSYQHHWHLGQGLCAGVVNLNPSDDLQHWCKPEQNGCVSL